MKKWTRVIPILIFLALGVRTVMAQASQPTDNDVNSIAKQLYCPVCENTPLDVCPTQACAEWRELIREKLSAGWSAEQIKQYFADQYGDRVLAAPPARGLNLFLYILPPAVILAGVYLLYRAFRSWRMASSETIPQGLISPTVSMVDSSGQTPAGRDPYAAQLEEELLKRS